VAPSERNLEGRHDRIPDRRWRHRQEFLGIQKHLARAYPDAGDGTQLHLVMDNYATHKIPR